MKAQRVAASPRLASTPAGVSGIINRVQDNVLAAVNQLASDAARGVSPTTPAGARQAGKLYMGAGVPDKALGQNGDHYLRTDTPGVANQRHYVKSAGAWVGIA